MKQTDEKGNPLTYWGGLEEQTKCYCGHTTICDCIPKEEPNQNETEHLLSTETNKNRLLKDVKQTAVEFLEEKFNNNNAQFINWSEDYFNDAKELEKHQIIDSCEKFGNLNGVDIEDYKQYYEQTFNK